MGRRKDGCYDCLHQPVCALWRGIHGAVLESYHTQPTSEDLSQLSALIKRTCWQYQKKEDEK